MRIYQKLMIYFKANTQIEDSITESEKELLLHLDAMEYHTLLVQYHTLRLERLRKSRKTHND
jgi:hypothetical protein